MEVDNFVNVRIRGLVAGQQWQSAFNLGVTSVAGEAGADWIFTQSALQSWFQEFWYGGSLVPEGGGILDLFRTLAAPNVSVQNVRVLARNQTTMNTPVQLEYFGNVAGLLSTAANRFMPSFQAASFLARKDDFGGRGAAMRLPFGNEDVAEDQYWATSFIALMQAFGDAIQGNAIDAGLTVLAGGGIANVEDIKPVVVENVLPAAPTSGDKKEFPYESPRPIRAWTLTGWTVHPYISTQNSRKIGRGI